MKVSTNALEVEAVPYEFVFIGIKDDRELDVKSVFLNWDELTPHQQQYFLNLCDNMTITLDKFRILLAQEEELQREEQKVV